jgi:probable rRNA maturation factor
MMEAVYNFDEIEDPPSTSFDSVKHSFLSVIQHPIFQKYKKLTTISVVFVNDLTMQSLNLQYRGKNSTTDVLTFPLNENLENEFLLGEIIISVDKARGDSEFLKITFYEEIMILLVHGVAHLLGYDHKNDQQELEMKEIENKLMNQISFSKGLKVYG